MEELTLPLEKNKEADGRLPEEYLKARPGRVRSRPEELLRLLSEPSSCSLYLTDHSCEPCPPLCSRRLVRKGTRFFSQSTGQLVFISLGEEKLRIKQWSSSGFGELSLHAEWFFMIIISKEVQEIEPSHASDLWVLI